MKNKKINWKKIGLVSLFATTIAAAAITPIYIYEISNGKMQSIALNEKPNKNEILSYVLNEANQVRANDLKTKGANNLDANTDLTIENNNLSDYEVKYIENKFSEAFIEIERMEAIEIDSLAQIINKYNHEFDLNLINDEILLEDNLVNPFFNETKNEKIDLKLSKNIKDLSWFRNLMKLAERGKKALSILSSTTALAAAGMAIAAIFVRGLIPRIIALTAVSISSGVAAAKLSIVINKYNNELWKVENISGYLLDVTAISISIIGIIKPSIVAVSGTLKATAWVWPTISAALAIVSTILTFIY